MYNYPTNLCQKYVLNVKLLPYATEGESVRAAKADAVATGSGNPFPRIYREGDDRRVAAIAMSGLPPTSVEDRPEPAGKTRLLLHGNSFQFTFFRSRMDLGFLLRTGFSLGERIGPAHS